MFFDSPRPCHSAIFVKKKKDTGFILKQSAKLGSIYYERRKLFLQVSPGLLVPDLGLELGDFEEIWAGRSLHSGVQILLERGRLYND